MRKVFFFLIAFLLVFTFSCIKPMSWSHKTLPSKGSVGIVKLKISNLNVGSRYISIGTGFTVNRNHALTAGHVCLALENGKRELAPHGRISVSYYTESGYLEARVVEYSFNPETFMPDYCLLKINTEGRILEPLKLRPLPKNYRHKVYIVGAPLGMFPALAEGVPISRDDLPADGFIYVYVPVAPGFSGGPILDKDGYVVGMLIAGATGYSNSLGISSDVLTRFLISQFAK